MRDVQWGAVKSGIALRLVALRAAQHARQRGRGAARRASSSGTTQNLANVTQANPLRSNNQSADTTHHRVRENQQTPGPPRKGRSGQRCSPPPPGATLTGAPNNVTIPQPNQEVTK